MNINVVIMLSFFLGLLVKAVESAFLTCLYRWLFVEALKHALAILRAHLLAIGSRDVGIFHSLEACVCVEEVR